MLARAIMKFKVRIDVKNFIADRIFIYTIVSASFSLSPRELQDHTRLTFFSVLHVIIMNAVMITTDDRDKADDAMANCGARLLR